MSSSSWNGNSGDWADSTQWSNGVPVAGDTAAFGGSNAYIVTFTADDDVFSVDGTDAAATLALTAQTLETGYWSWAGAYDQSGGALLISAITADWTGNFLQTGGLLELTDAEADWYGGFTLAGGQIQLTGIDPIWSETATISGGTLAISATSGYPAQFEGGVQLGDGGVLGVETGTADILGDGSTLAGVISGDGTLSLGGGEPATIALLPSVTLDGGELLIASYADVLLGAGTGLAQDYLVAGNFDAHYSSTLNSDGQDFTLGPDGSGIFAGTFSGGGLLAVEGAYDLSGLALTGTGTTVEVFGAAIQEDQSVTLGVAATDTDAMTIAQTGTYDLTGEGDSPAAISGNSLSVLDILGTLEVTDPAGTTDIQVETVILAGSINITGALDLEGPYSSLAAQADLASSSDIGGIGTLQIGNYETAIASGDDITVAYLQIGGFSGGELLLAGALGYDGFLVDGAGTIDTNGDTLTFGAAATGTLANVIDGGGTVVVAGAMALFGPTVTGAGTELLITGVARDGELSGTGDIVLGTAGVATTLSVGSTGTLNFAIGFGIAGAGDAQFDNAGLIELTDDMPYTGPTLDDVSFTNSGVIELQQGFLELDGGAAALGGLIRGPGTLDLDGGNVTMLAGVTLDSSYLSYIGAKITLSADLAYAGTLQGGSGTTFDTQGYDFTVRAGELTGVFAGGGTVIAQGSMDTAGIIAPDGAIYLTGIGTTLLDEAEFTQDGGGLVLGETSGDADTLSIASGALYSIVDSSGITDTGAGPTGLIENAGGFIVNQVNPLFAPTAINVGSFVNTGEISDMAGGLQITASLVNDGLITVDGELQISGNVTSDIGDTGSFVIGDGATLGFDGNYLTNPVPASLVAASQTISFAAAAGELYIENPGLFAGTITNFVAGDTISTELVPDSIGRPNTFTYGDGVLTLQAVIEVSQGDYETLSVGTLALPGINPADLQLFYNGVSGFTDIELNNTPTGDAPYDDQLGNNLTAYWEGPSGANWSNAADWDTDEDVPNAPTNPQIFNVVPFQGYDIDIASAISLVFDAGSTPSGEFTAAVFDGVYGSTFNLNGGQFVVQYGYYNPGVLDIAGGSLEILSNEAAGLAGTLNLAAAGLLQIDDGTFAVGAAGTTTNDIAGTLAGAGEIILQTGTFDIESSAVLAVATLVLGGNADVLEGNQSFTGQVFQNTRLLDLNGYDFLLPASGMAILGGTITGGGTFTVAGTAALDGSVYGPGTELLITGTAYNGDSGAIVGTAYGAIGSAEIVIAQTGTLLNAEITGNYGSTLINDGLMEQTQNIVPYDQNGLYEEVNDFLDGPTGTLEIETGNMAFHDAVLTLAGAVQGGGQLELDADVTTLAAGALYDIAATSLSSGTMYFESSLDYQGQFDDSVGLLVLGGNNLTLGGPPTVATQPIIQAVGKPQEVGPTQPGGSGNTLGNGILSGAVTGGGVLQIGGDYDITGFRVEGAGTELLDTGSIDVGPGGFELGIQDTDTNLFDVAATATLDFIGPDDGDFSTGNFNSTLLNSGVLELTQTGLNGFQLATFINTGTIAVPLGALEIETTFGTLGGLVTGGGELYLNSFGTITLEPGLTLDPGTLYLETGVFQLGADTDYNGLFEEFNPTINTNGFTLDLGPQSGGDLQGYIVGGGEVELDGTAVLGSTEIWAAATTLLITGEALVDNTVYAGATGSTGPGAVIAIAAGGTFDIAGDGFVGGIGIYDNFTLDNAGLLEKTGVISTETITATSFINTGTIAALNGAIDITGNLVNNGTVFEDGLGGVIIGGAETGTGVNIIDPAAVTLSAAIGAGQSFAFAGSGGTLVLTDAPAFLGTITGFDTGDIIDISNIGASAITGSSFANGTLTLDDGATIINLAIEQAGDAATPLTFTSDAGSGLEVVTEVTCYAAGTRIRTTRGEIPVEQLTIGDILPTLHAGPQRIKWIGHRSYAGRFIANNKIALPICITAHAIADGIPARDLWVSPGHAICIGGALVHAAKLVNGTSIYQAASVDSVTYYHIELDNHEVIFAENCPAESFMGEVFRAQFHNAATYPQLYPGAAAPASSCLPRSDGSAARIRITAREQAVAFLTIPGGPVQTSRLCRSVIRL